jgi:hypothetical protein
VSKALQGERLCGPQHDAKPAASLEARPFLGGDRESRAAEITVKAMEGAEDLEVQAPKDSPAYGARNVQIVTAGTGEALPGPATCGALVLLPECGAL